MDKTIKLKNVKLEEVISKTGECNIKLRVLLHPSIKEDAVKINELFKLMDNYFYEDCEINLKNRL